MTWEKARARREQRAKEAVACLNLAGHNLKLGLLLDSGCGEGYLTRYFLELGIETVGVDISRERVKFAKKNVPTGSLIVADGVKLPFKKEIFNTVILNDVLEHVPYNLAKPMLNEIRRTLKVDGKLYISVANKYQILEPHTLTPFLAWLPRPCWNPIHKMIKKRPIPHYYYNTLNPYTIKRLKRLCLQTGFAYRNYTWFYVWNKLSDIEHIGNLTIKKIGKMIKKLKILKLACILAEKISVILFVCSKEN